MNLFSLMNSLWHDFYIHFQYVTTSSNNYYYWNMQAMDTHHNTHNGAGVGGSNAAEENPNPSPPPPYTVETFFAQFLSTQRNMEALQREMRESLCNVADNTR
jgi:hypothetical protein